jgi:hypothetical protein
VRLRDAIGADAVWLIGHDRRGDVMIQALMKRRHCSVSAIESVARWCKENDDPIDLGVI